MVNFNEILKSVSFVVVLSDLVNDMEALTDLHYNCDKISKSLLKCVMPVNCSFTGSKDFSGNVSS